MIDLKDLRDNPDKYRAGSAAKGYDPTLVDQLVQVDAQLRAAQTEREQLTAEKNRLGKDMGPLMGKLKKAAGPDAAAIQQQIDALKSDLASLKDKEHDLDARVKELEPQRHALHLEVPQPPDADVPRGKSPADNVEIRRWNPTWFDPRKSFAENKGFPAKSHVELMAAHAMVDFDRGVKLSGSRSYVLTGPGFALHNAVLRYAFDFMTATNGFTPVSAPCLVREATMIGTGFFPHGRDTAYHIANPTSEGDQYYLTGTGEVGLMGLHADEIVDAAKLPLCYTTVSTCFRREAGSAGKDTAGLYRIHQFDKVEQVVICKADETESRRWHGKMINFVEQILQSLDLPYRLLQCCTADLGPKNADMIDLECWMPSRGSRFAESLSTLDNYVLVGQPGDFWANVRPNPLESFVNRCGHNFHVVIHRDEIMYRIPFVVLAPHLNEATLHHDEVHGDRWIVHITNDRLSIGRKGDKPGLDLSEFRHVNPTTGEYGETHSASRLYDYQTRRLNIRYKDPDTGKNTIAHSLNNTVAASPRILIPIVEMYQNADGSITVPTVLRPYMNGRERIA